MAILGVIAVLVCRKSDTLNNMAISLWLILMHNPFAITNTGLILSYLATLGIILLMPIWLSKIKEENTKKAKWLQKGKTLILVSVSAWIAILPIHMLLFQTISVTFLVSNLMVSFLTGIIMMLGFLVSLPISIPLVAKILSMVVSILIWISEIFSNFPLSNILVCPPHIPVIILYFGSLFTWIYIQKLRDKTDKRRIEKQCLTYIEYRKQWLWKHKVMVISFVSVFVMICLFFKTLPQDLNLYFIDVGQGDCTLMTTPHHKTILIDGGGSRNNEEYDVGKSVLLPYLLNHHIKKIDMVVVSHFDADHSNGLVAILENLEVSKLVIGKQKEESEEYKTIIGIAKDKSINIQVVEQKNQIKIEDGLWFDVLFPEENLKLQGLNNNSLVLRLNTGNFKMLFTGDIEKEAEQKLLTTNKENDMLKATAIKIAHHGSKTSTTTEFLKAVNPKIALIGVGANNLFGHPNSEVLERLKQNGSKVFRTDKDGEIRIRVNRKGKIWIDKMLNEYSPKLENVKMQ